MPIVLPHVRTRDSEVQLSTCPLSHATPILSFVRFWAHSLMSQKVTRPHHAPLKPRPLERPRPLQPHRAPPPAARPSVEAPARPRPAARPRPSAPATPPECHDNESAPRAPLLLGRDPGWTAGPGLGATAATAAFVSSPSPSRPASPRLIRARGRGPSPPPLPRGCRR